MQAVADEPRPAADRLRRFFQRLTTHSREMFFQDRKMHDIVAAALNEKWQSVANHHTALLAIIRQIVTDGREAGEFERKTPLDETCRAILLAVEPIANPAMVEQRLDTIEEDSAAMANLVLRSLAP